MFHVKHYSAVLLYKIFHLEFNWRVPAAYKTAFQQVDAIIDYNHEGSCLYSRRRRFIDSLLLSYAQFRPGDRVIHIIVCMP